MWEKKIEQAGGLRAKVDTYVLETQIHYPTDISLLYDSGRKCLDTIDHLMKYVALEGWRNSQDWRRRLRNEARRVGQVSAGGGKNKVLRLTYAVNGYLDLANTISQKVQASLKYLEAGLNRVDPMLMVLTIELKKYHQYLLKLIDQVDRRLLQGETIPHAEKIFSIFEPHTEWINKGKRHPKVELGHPIMVATDQFHFILVHQVVQNQADVALAQPVVKSIKERYDQFLQSISFDRGFYSKLNKEALSKEVNELILPKKGKKNAQEQQEESQKEFVQLRHQHSAVEANINQLEHHGLNKCPDKGIDGFKRYAALGVLAYNLHRLGNLITEQRQVRRAKAFKRKRAA